MWTLQTNLLLFVFLFSLQGQTSVRKLYANEASTRADLFATLSRSASFELCAPSDARGHVNEMLSDEMSPTTVT